MVREQMRLPVTALPEEQLQAVWRALDADSSGYLSTGCVPPHKALGTALLLLVSTFRVTLFSAVSSASLCEAVYRPLAARVEKRSLRSRAASVISITKLRWKRDSDGTQQSVLKMWCLRVTRRCRRGSMHVTDARDRHMHGNPCGVRHTRNMHTRTRDMHFILYRCQPPLFPSLYIGSYSWTPNTAHRK